MASSLSGYRYKVGPCELDTQLTTASTAIAVNDALAISSGTLAVLTSGAKALGVSLGTKALADAATTAKQFIRANTNGRQKYLAYVKAGTLASTGEDALVELSGTTGAMGINATATNGDFYCYKVLVAGTAGSALVTFADPSYLNATN